MLIRLEIKNFAVISDLYFEPSKGLNVISGETGAGKSLLVDAIGLILGNKASKNLIRTGENEAFVEALFDLTNLKNESLFSMLKDAGLDSEENILIISRKISLDGKSIARINGRTVVLSVLKEIASNLIDIHGQHDTQKIFDEKSHIGLLDNFGGQEIREVFEEYKKLLAEYKDIVLEIRNLSKSPEYFEKRKEYLSFAIDEIEEANFKIGEDKELFSQKEKFQRISEFAEDLNYANLCINSDGDNVSTIDNLNKALNSLTKVSNLDSAYEDLKDRFSAIYYELEEIASEISTEANKLDYNPEEKENNDKRIGLLFELQSKYGNSIEEIIEFKNNAKNELDSMDDNKKHLKDLKLLRQRKESDLLEVSEKLSNLRKEKALVLSTLISNELKDLEMPNSRFVVDFQRRPKEKFFSSNGIDDISFLFSANLGQDLKPLSSIASGGEASRIMLAIKNILSSCDIIPTLIFDEIDTGVSGLASNSIALKLKSISKHHQTLCVSHTSQMAAAADNNFMLYKKIEGDFTNTYCTKLEGDDKVREVSRLLSGSKTDESIKLAKSLIESFRSEQ